MLYLIALIASVSAFNGTRFNEVWTREQEIAAGIKLNSEWQSPRPQDYLKDEDVPAELNWCDKDGVNYCTMSRNQHLPQYCGSCWAHGAISALGDRIKIARKAQGIDINLAVQHVLNCANVGSCHGGSVAGVYSWLSQASKSGTGISYETSQPYMACSSESKEGFCASADWTCKAENIARTCSTFSSNGGFCSELTQYPNATISEYGTISGVAEMQKEILARGPISCGIDASPILKYQTGIATDKGEGVDHVVSVTGWGQENGQSYWIVRNSWGEYWGEQGYIRVAFGALMLEQQCAWAVPDVFTAPENNNQFHCYEDGSNCV
jgi:cathepsin X